MLLYSSIAAPPKEFVASFDRPVYSGKEGSFLEAVPTPVSIHI